jgi:hypothetical protein
MKQEIFKHSSTNFLRNKRRNELIRKKRKEEYQRKAGTFLLKTEEKPLQFNIDSDHIKL